METLTFLVFAALALGSALVVVSHKNPVYSTISLVVTLFAVAVLFVMLGAPFVGVLQVLIYTGAIVVLFLFVIMLLNLQPRSRDESPFAGQGLQLAGAVIGGLILWFLIIFAFSNTSFAVLKPLTAEMVSLKTLARDLFTEYLLPFEIVGLLLLVAVIGATVVARKVPQADSTAGYLPDTQKPPEGTEP
ncbi:MAG TPA: NADH-quinone oxidoreductase subunit J [Thermoanaerobaculia bacterium]